MKAALFVPLLLLLSCGQSKLRHSEIKGTAVAMAIATPFTRPDHIFIVWFENKGYKQIIGNPEAPYINSLLPQGTLFTHSHAVAHPSYPNYVAFFAGSDYNIANDDCIAGTPLPHKTMYNSLRDAGASFVWYSEDLPRMGSDTCTIGEYAEKHNPTTIFSKVPPSANVPLAALNFKDTTSFAGLPNVICLTPNLMHDMHDGSIAEGDAWLQSHCAPLIRWCTTHNSVFIVYYDEDNGQEENRVPVIMLGQHIKANHKDTAYHSHYGFAKSILNWWGADSTFTPNLAHAKTIKNIWK